METYFENLRDYILDKHPDVSDSQSVLEMIYECYAQLNRMDNETIRKDFDELYQAMHGHSLREIDNVIYTVCTLCRDHEKCKEFYEQRFSLLHAYLDKAFSQLKNGELAYALYEARRVLEETLEQYIKHYFSESKLGKTPEENIDICLRKKLLGEDVIKSLHNARRQCNKDPHEIDARENLDYKTAWTVLLQVESFLEIAECDLIYG